jgi:hypothetical protein
LRISELPEGDVRRSLNWADVKNLSEAEEKKSLRKAIAAYTIDRHESRIH